MVAHAWPCSASLDPALISIQDREYDPTALSILEIIFAIIGDFFIIVSRMRSRVFLFGNGRQSRLQLARVLDTKRDGRDWLKASYEIQNSEW